MYFGYPLNTKITNFVTFHNTAYTKKVTLLGRHKTMSQIEPLASKLPISQTCARRMFFDSFIPQPVENLPCELPQRMAGRDLCHSLTSFPE